MYLYDVMSPIMFSDPFIDEQFIRKLLRDINERRNDLPLHNRKIWPDAPDKILDHLQIIIDHNLIEGALIPFRGERTICIDKITWQGEEVLNRSS
ncbi:MAG: hypothetical protein F4158_07610 [Synechococcus sp. SB0675_bin_7]|nr:hypothetical protein [Cyanobacteria bacterium MAG IRC3_bin_20]MYG64407.1 hypothetical protein [Synechococcus sp. SB0675_bin_7]